jgi:hypothetical protein
VEKDRENSTTHMECNQVTPKSMVNVKEMTCCSGVAHQRDRKGNAETAFTNWRHERLCPEGDEVEVAEKEESLEKLEDQPSKPTALSDIPVDVREQDRGCNCNDLSCISGIVSGKNTPTMMVKLQEVPGVIVSRSEKEGGELSMGQGSMARLGDTKELALTATIAGPSHEWSQCSEIHKAEELQCQLGLSNSKEKRMPEPFAMKMEKAELKCVTVKKIAIAATVSELRKEVLFKL